MRSVSLRFPGDAIARRGLPARRAGSHLGPCRRAALCSSPSSSSSLRATRRPAPCSSQGPAASPHRTSARAAAERAAGLPDAEQRACREAAAMSCGVFRGAALSRPACARSRRASSRRYDARVLRCNFGGCVCACVLWECGRGVCFSCKIRPGRYSPGLDAENEASTCLWPDSCARGGRWLAGGLARRRFARIEIVAAGGGVAFGRRCWNGLRWWGNGTASNRPELWGTCSEPQRRGRCSARNTGQPCFG